ncbi:MAG: hypoxanthine phosphoribosyltransferase [Firmicutes bacterium]|nr:hypoxanthine phosphoribosyltransferase [Bacillota bacterium]
MSEKIEVLINKSSITKRVEEMGQQIDNDYNGEEVFLVGILKGSVIFLSDIARNIKRSPVAMGFMSVSSYGSSTVGGELRIKMDLSEDIAGKNVLIVEDIIDTGRTLKLLKQLLEGRGAKSVKACTFLNKPERRTVDIEADYTGFEIPDKFVVGYGLDFDQRYRNLEYIGVISFEDDAE